MNVANLIEWLSANHLQSTGRGEHDIYFRCPFHKQGRETHSSANISVITGEWFCHTCGQGGSLRWLLIKLGVDRRIIDMADDLPAPRPAVDIDDRLPVGLLWAFRRCPTFLLDLGFDKQTLADNQVGFDSRPAYQRITWPIFDRRGQLRAVSGGSPTGRQPKYLVYRRQDYQGLADLPVYEPKKSRYLWREQSVDVGADLLLTEGYKACLWAVQAGVHALALSGVHASVYQINTIKALAPTSAVIALDDDDAGLTATTKLLTKLLSAGIVNVRVFAYPPVGDDGDRRTTDQLDKLTVDCLRQGIDNAQSTGQFYRANKFRLAQARTRSTHYE